MSGIGKLMGDIFGTAVTPEQIYEQITNGPGATSVGNAVHAARSQVELQTSINDRVRRLQELMGTGWTGDASDRARNAATPVAQVAEEATAELQRSQALLDMQNGGYERAKNTVVQMPPNPGQPDVLDTTFPILTDHAERQAVYNAAARVNNDAFDMYQGLSTEVGSGMPTSYGGLNTDTGATEISLKAAPAPGPPGAPLSSGPTIGAPAGAPSESADSTGQQPVTPVGSGSVPTVGGHAGGGQGYDLPPAAETGDIGGSLDDSTSAAGYVAPDGSSVLGGGRPGGFADLGGIKAGTSFGGGTPTSPGPGFGGSYQVGGAVPGSGAAPGAGAPGSRGGGLGSGKLTGGAPGTGSTAGAGSSASTGSSGATRGGARAPMMGAPGGGRGKGGEDEEHQRPSYLEESDPDGVFIGDLPNTTPAVIGLERPKTKDR